LFSINWDVEDQEAIFLDKKTAKKLQPDFDFNLLLSSNEVAKINRDLKNIGDDIKDIETRFELDGKTFSSEDVIKQLIDTRRPRTKKAVPGISIVDFFHQFAKDSTGTHKTGTLKVYSGLAAHMAEFEKTRSIKITFENIDNQSFSWFPKQVSGSHPI
jgi:hypothetical protein